MQRRLAMNLADISSIKKERFAFVLDNAIKIVLQGLIPIQSLSYIILTWWQTDGQSFIFTSITQRDDAFNSILIQMQKNCNLVVHLDHTKRCVTFSPEPTLPKIVL